jgi:hypothetical protein
VLFKAAAAAAFGAERGFFGAAGAATVGAAAAAAAAAGCCGGTAAAGAAATGKIGLPSKSSTSTVAAAEAAGPACVSMRPAGMDGTGVEGRFVRVCTTARTHANLCRFCWWYPASLCLPEQSRHPSQRSPSAAASSASSTTVITPRPLRAPGPRWAPRPIVNGGYARLNRSRMLHNLGTGCPGLFSSCSRVRES